jgi:hypothetical protein
VDGRVVTGAQAKLPRTRVKDYRVNNSMPSSQQELSCDPSNSQERRLDFLGIGSQKSGTTSLNAYLRDHPQIQLVAHEAHFFDNEKTSWPPINWADYHSQLPRKRNHQDYVLVRGEITPIYLYWQPCLERIRAYNPNIKLIALLRNPVCRAYSHWAMETHVGKESLSFSEAIRSEDERLANAPLGQHRVYSYAARGRYHVQLEHLLQLFPRKQLHVIKSEDFFANSEKVLTEVYHFLNLPTQPVINNHHCREGTYSGQMNIDDWNYLYAKLANDIAKLEALLDWDCGDWKIPDKALTGAGLCLSSRQPAEQASRPHTGVSLINIAE